MTAELPTLLLVSGVAGAAVFASFRLPDGWRARLKRWPLLMGLVAIGFGYTLVIENPSLFDDAFISFRYADNLVAGDGLVWNVGERVEGYTNFLWTVVIAGLIAVTPWEAPAIALALCLLCYGANLVVVWRIGRLLAGDRVTHWPIAVVVLALSPLFAEFGTSGLETMACSLAVDLALLALLARDDVTGAALAGSAGIAAALLRPDHGIFYVVGGVVLLVARRRALKSSLRHVAAYSAPFVVYLVYAWWKIGYYGELLPNTYYAKSADITWYEQGIVYLATFWLPTWAWLHALLLVVWLAVGPRDEATVRFGAFAVLGIVLFDIYVAKVGGDFMWGRFLLTMTPLVALAGDGFAHSLARSGRPLATAAVVGLMAASTVQLDLPLEQKRREWHIRDQATIYELDSWDPVHVRHPSWKIGEFFADAFAERGLEPVLGTGGIGIVGYLSGLPIVDVRGLTDATVAHQPLERRRRPGHEKVAPREYIVERKVHLLRMGSGQQLFHPKRFRKLATVRSSTLGKRNPWQIAVYDRELMEAMFADVPEVKFTHFPEYLDDYIATLDGKKHSRVADDLRWFRRYWFDHNEDPRRLQAIERWLSDNRP